MSGPVDWQLARRVARRVSGTEPFSTSYHAQSLVPDFTRFTAQAEELVAETTGLRSLAGPARARVTDRNGWVDANVASFQRLLRPVLDKFAAKMRSGPMATIAARATGVELGMLLGWMSGRVLGQYDLLVIEEESPHEQDLVYYVGPNILALEKRFAFPPEQFRLWIAIHEVTHRAQFTGVPWLRAHFLGLVDELLSHVDPDPARLFEALGRAAEATRRGERPMADGGLAALFANPEQRAVLERVSGLMSLLEGHGDVTMSRAGADLVPAAGRFERVLKQRRQNANPLSKLVQRALGLEAKLAQYEQGERFIEAVETAGGAVLLDRVWEGPEYLPSLAEVRAPQTWIARVGGSAVAEAAR